ncbi:MAG: 6-phosphogluconolactonase [Paracoccaceae bacterium]|nr:6-phosphogluconolactonase [Paracoccaceae bacterium]
MKFITYPNRETLIASLSDIVTAELGHAIEKNGAASLSVPGGTTPGPMFDRLNQSDLEWSKVAILLNDERWVPETSPRSNTALLRARLIQNKAAVAQFIPLYADAETPEEGLVALSVGVEAVLPLDVLVLGMGGDMHTASLFPGADLLEKSLADDAPTLLPMRAAGAGEPRITLTAPVLKAAKHIHVLIMGEEKRTALEAAMKLNEIDAPIKAVLENASVHWAV